MYQQCGSSSQLSGLGLSLPSWLTKAAGAVIRGTIVTLPTPAGPVTVDLGDPASVARAKAIVSGATVSTSVANKPQNPIQQINADVTSKVPGGWLTIAAAALAAALLLPRLLRSSRG